MRVVIEFDNFETAEDFVETCMELGVVMSDNGFGYDFAGYEFTKDGDIEIEVKARKYETDDFGDFDNYE